MKIKETIILLIILLSYSVPAEETLKQGSSTTIGGKTFTLVSVGETNNAVVSVDGVKNIVNLNQEKQINGINVLLTSLSYMGEDSVATFILESVAEAEAAAKPHVVVCGDNVCEGTEDKDNCCKDCGCKYGYGCENNKCVKAECMEDKDCYPTQKDYCILDKCDPITKKCIHKSITDCIINDKCCPTNCYYPDDPDCPTTKLNPNPQTTTQTPIEEIQESIETNQTTQKETKKPSLISRIIIWIINIFK